MPVLLFACVSSAAPQSSVSNVYCLYIHTHTHIYIYIHTYIYTYIYIYIHIYTHIYIVARRCGA